MFCDDDGYLEPGIHYMTWKEFYKEFSFSPKRKLLLEGLERAIKVLTQCGCVTLYVDGSFVTRKLEPNDFDACWEGDLDAVAANLQEYEPIFLDFTNGRKKQKLKYFGAIFPAEIAADLKGTPYLDFFQQIRFSENKKGIVAIKL